MGNTRQKAPTIRSKAGSLANSRPADLDIANMTGKPNGTSSIEFHCHSLLPKVCRCEAAILGIAAISQQWAEEPALMTSIRVEA
jgi:hypothetical protein